MAWCGVVQLAALERLAIRLRVPGWRTLAEYSEAVGAGFYWSRREVAVARSLGGYPLFQLYDRVT